MQIKFTPAQCAALLHRLEVGDCIAEVFADTEGLQRYAPHAEERCADLARQLVNYGSVRVLCADLDQAILVECVEGSTYAAALDDGTNSPALRASYRTLDGLAVALQQSFHLVRRPLVPRA